ncbi:MAG: hypothetical protein IKJ83_01450 [Ruminococcus sp.]|nr:hypothetical protein [Ruminococcus sp.]
MQKKEYIGIEMKINIFTSEEVVVASSVTPSKPEFDGTRGSNDLPIL